MSSRSRQSLERGQVVVLFALMVPMILALGGVVIGIGNWYVHAKNLQTKADAGALAGGNAWSFPCVGTATDTTIKNEAYRYAGPDAVHTTGTNPQVGGVPGSKIHTVLNGPDFYDDDGNPSPSEFTSPAGNVCDAKMLDVKSTEDNSFPLASLIPLFPDIKRQARVQIEEQNGTSGLLPIAVRVPKPVSVAAVYVNETPGPNYGDILSARYFKDICEAPAYSDCNATIPNALDQWTTENSSPLPPGSSTNKNAADISSMPPQTGVVIALSFRPACPGASPCFNISAPTTIDQLCNQGSGAGTAQCYYTTGGATQTFQSGLQFIRSWSSNSDPQPDLLSTWIGSPIVGNLCYQGYFSAPVANACTVTLNANIDPGFNGQGNTEIRYKLVSGNTAWQEDDAPGPCNNNYGTSCGMPGGIASVQLDPAYARHAVGIAILRGNLPNAVITANNLPAQCANAPSLNCAWFFPDSTGNARGTANPQGNGGAARIFDNPVQRAFMGNINRSGPVKFLHLYNVDCTSGGTIAGGVETGDAASVQTGRRCFKMEMGLQGALAREQDEEPIVLNIGDTSQSAVVDCDPSISNIKDEIVLGCGGDDGFPTYKKNDFTASPYCPNVSGANQFFGTTSWNGTAWPPFQCVLTQTSASANQIVQGLNERFFGTSNNPSCPADTAQFVKGRNYWHDANNDFTGDPDGSGPEPSQADYYTFARSSRNHPNHLRNDDPRFVLLFITPYNSFTGNGNETYPISLIGGFYITGYARLNGNGSFQGGIEDPCSDGSGLAVGAGNTPPPDLDYSNNGAVAWGHFVVPVDLGGSSGGTGILCQPSTPMACIAVLVK